MLPLSEVLSSTNIIFVPGTRLQPKYWTSTSATTSPEEPNLQAIKAIRRDELERSQLPPETQTEAVADVAGASNVEY